MKRWWMGLTLVLAANMAMAKPIELKGRFWRPDLSGNGQFSSGAVAGTTFDIERDLQLNTPNLPELRVDWFVGDRWNARFRYLYFNYDGYNPNVGATNPGLTIDGQAFNADLVSAIDIHYLTVGGAWHAVRAPWFDGYGFLDLKYLGSKARFSSPQQNVASAVSAPVPLAAIGIGASVRPWQPLELYGEFGGLPLGSYGSHIDAEGGVRVYPVSDVFVEVGYRWFNLDVQEDSGANADQADITLEGPFLSANFTF